MPMLLLRNWQSIVGPGLSRPTRNSPSWERCYLCISCHGTRGPESSNGTMAIERFLRPDRFLPTQGQEVLRAFNRLGHLAQQFLQVLIAVDEINLRGVDDQQV